MLEKTSAVVPALPADKLRANKGWEEVNPVAIWVPLWNRNHVNRYE